jgi:type I restriction enzyme S subunit
MTGLPEGWVGAKIADVAQVITGNTPPSAGGEELYAGSIPFYRPNDVEFGKVLTYASKCVSDIGLSYSRKIPARSTLLVCIGSVGKASLTSVEGCTNQQINTLAAYASVAEPKWLFRTVCAPQFQETLKSLSSATTISIVNKGKVEGIVVPLPPLPEQRRIVRKLDTLTARTTTAHTHLTAVEKLVERYKESVRQEAFAGTISARWRVNSETEENGSALLEHVRHLHKAYWLEKQRKKSSFSQKTNSDAVLLKKYKASGHLVEKDQLHEVPNTWAWAVAEEIVEPGAEIVYGIVQPGPKLEDGIPYVRGMDIVNGVIQTGQLLKTSPEIAHKYERASLKGNDILLGIIRATKVAIVPIEIEGANITQGTARFRPSEVISTEYLAHWLASRTAQSWLHAKYRGIDMPGLNLRDVRQLPVPLPPLDEQREIVRRIETAFEKIDRLAAEAAKALKLVGHLDQRILAKAFAGELVPQDPSDEPAEILLARIREAREAAPKAKRKRKTSA